MDATKKDSPWPGYIKLALEQLDDPLTYQIIFPYMEKKGHPRVEDHRIMADTLIAFIEREKLL